MEKKYKTGMIAAKLCLDCGSPTKGPQVCPECRVKRRDYQRKWEQDLRIEVFAHYGGKCACPPCGQTIWQFLTLDHKDGNGNAHRREIGVHGGGKFYSWVKKNNYPTYLQLLCISCNFGKSRGSKKGGVCPHLLQQTPQTPSQPAYPC